MLQEKIVSAKSEEQALNRAALEFGVDTDKLSCEMIETAKKGFFGFGAQDAKYRISYEDGKPAPKKPETPSFEKKEQKPEPSSKKNFDKKHEHGEKKPEQKKPEQEKPKTPVAPEALAGLDKVVSFIDMILADMKLDAKAQINSCDSEDVFIEIVGKELGVIIGHHGEVLDSIQYLANIVNDNEKGDAGRIHVDVENYRSKREETLNKLADRMAAKVLSTGRSVTLEPMNPYERRIIHSRIQGIEGVTTRSVGTDLGRKVVISAERSGGAKNDKYSVERPEYNGSDGKYDRYTAPSEN